MARYKSVWVSVGAMKEEKKKLLGAGTKTSENPQYVDRPELASSIDAACETLADEGFEVFSIMPTVRGYSQAQLGAQSGYGYGYSVTDGAIVTGRKLS